ncbi:MAG: nucleotidyltransferase family protein [Oceanicaulis sp.]
MKITTAMAMAAGRGTRMRPLTDTCPKAMVEVCGKPLIDWTLDKFAEAGVERAVVNIHHYADLLEAHISGRAAPKIVISDERETLLETGGGLVKAAPLLGPDPVFVANSDSVWIDEADQGELSRLEAAYDPESMDALLLLAPLERQLGYGGKGDFLLHDDGRIERRGDRDQAPFAYAGVQVLHPRLLEGEPEEVFSTNKLWDKALKASRLFGLPMASYWMHVGDPDAKTEAENRLGCRG